MHAEYEYNSPEPEYRHAKMDILGYALIILEKSTFLERPCMPYRNQGRIQGGATEAIAPPSQFKF